MKMRQIQNYMNVDGEIPKGTYIVEGELKDGLNIFLQFFYINTYKFIATK